MFANALTLNANAFSGDNTDKVYDLVGWGGDSSSIRRVSATASTAPEVLKIAHRELKEGGIDLNQHLVRVDNVLLDGLGKQWPYSAWLVIKHPLGTATVSHSQVKNQVGRLLSLIQASGAFDRIMNSEP